MMPLKQCFIIVLLAKLVLLVIVALMLNWQLPWQVPAGVTFFDDHFSCHISSWDGQYKPQQRFRNVTRVILFWTTYFSYKDFAFGYGNEPFVANRCPVQNCLTTSDRQQLYRADAIIFHVRNLDPYDLPPVRYSCQRWVFFLLESPFNTYLNLGLFRNFFNWTMTYRFDSDIPPSIKLLPRKHSLPSQNHAANKTKLAVWLVSNCWSFSHRERYVREMQKYISVDIYGECGQQDELCSKNTSLRHCYKSFEKVYKFYLSFENSFCVDYFTEKLLNIYEHDMVPVVFGKVNYSRHTPPHSLIDVSDFASPFELSKHLLRINADDALYNEFFEWKRHDEFAIVSSPWCDVCDKLNRRTEPNKVYEDIEKWWIDGSNCSNDDVGQWKISSWWDKVLDPFSVKYNSLRHHVNLYLQHVFTF